MRHEDALLFKAESQMIIQDTLRTCSACRSCCWTPLTPVTSDAGTVEGQLVERAKLAHTQPTLAALASASKVAAQRTRVGLAAANLVGRANLVRAVLQQRASGSNSAPRRPRSEALSSTDDAGA